jgi:hypothetical protein
MNFMVASSCRYFLSGTALFSQRTIVRWNASLFFGKVLGMLNPLVRRMKRDFVQFGVSFLHRALAARLMYDPPAGLKR